MAVSVCGTRFHKQNKRAEYYHGILSSVRKAKKLASIVNISVVIKIASIILGLVLTTIAFFIDHSAPGPIWVVLFNAIWSIPILFLTVIRK